MPSFTTLSLGFGMYIIVYSLMFLGCLPLIAHRHKAGEDIAPLLRRIAVLCFIFSLIGVVLGFWLYDKAI